MQSMGKSLDEHTLSGNKGGKVGQLKNYISIIRL